LRSILFLRERKKRYARRDAEKKGGVEVKKRRVTARLYGDRKKGKSLSKRFLRRVKVKGGGKRAYSCGGKRPGWAVKGKMK